MMSTWRCVSVRCWNRLGEGINGMGGREGEALDDAVVFFVVCFS